VTIKVLMKSEASDASFSLSFPFSSLVRYRRDVIVFND
jgi:hypothetical protein